MYSLWHNFFVLMTIIFFITLIIFYVGDRMAFYADQLAKSTGISGALIGFILIAMITSVPEMVSTFVATSNQLYGLATGGVLGSNIVNLAILSGIFLIFRDRELEIKRSSIFSFLSGLLLLAVVGILFTVYPVSKVIVNKYYVSFIILVIYIGIMYHSFSLNQEEQEEQEKEQEEILPLGKTIVPFIFYSGIIIGLSWGLVIVCQQMTVVPIPIYGKTLGEHFVGTLILAVSTSIPELATSYQIVRRGQTNMAVENIAGSNIFNLMVLVVASLTTPSPFWSEIPINSLYTVFMIFIVSLLMCIIGLVRESKKFSLFMHGLIIMIWLYSLVLVF